MTQDEFEVALLLDPLLDHPAVDRMIECMGIDEFRDVYGRIPRQQFDAWVAELRSLWTRFEHDAMLTLALKIFGSEPP